MGTGHSLLGTSFPHEWQDSVGPL